MKPHPSPARLSLRLRTALLATTLVLVNAGGFLLARAAQEDTLLKGIDPKAVERTADSLNFSRDHVRELFKSDVAGAIGDTGALTSRGQDVDVQRLREMVAGNLGDTDLTSGSPAELHSKFSQLQTRVSIQSEISQRVSIASFESAVMDKQVNAVTDKMQDLDQQRDKVTSKYKEVLQAADKASSYVNNLPPM